jgi:hypothetical protein
LCMSCRQIFRNPSKKIQFYRLSSRYYLMSKTLMSKTLTLTDKYLAPRLKVFCMHSLFNHRTKSKKWETTFCGLKPSLYKSGEQQPHQPKFHHSVTSAQRRV